MKKQSFLKGSALLILSVIIAKAIGALFKIPLTNILGGTGMGYFSSAYGLFLPVYAVCVTGLTTAVAKLTADNIAVMHYRNARRVRDISLMLFSIAGVIGTGIIILSADFFAQYAVKSPLSYVPILMISPSILFGCITAVYRGYFEGLHNMTPTAVSQVIEAVFKLVCGLILCVLAVNYPQFFMDKFPLLFPNGTEVNVIGASMAILGVTISCFAGMIYTIVKCKKDGITEENLKFDNYYEKRRVIGSKMMKIFIPVSLGALVTNLTSFIDLATIIRGLNSAIEKCPDLFSAIIPPAQFADFAYGSFIGMSITIFNLVPAITNMFGKGVFPAIADANVKKDRVALEKNINSALFATSFIALPSGLGILILAKPILTFLYSSRLLEVEVVYQSLSYLGIGVILCCISFPVFSILQALGRADLTLKIMLVGAAVKLVGNILLIPIPKYNISGAAISTVICYGFIVILSLYYLKKIANVKINIFKVFIAPGYAALLCAVTAMLTYSFAYRLPNTLSLPLSICTGGVMYLLCAWLLSLPKMRYKIDIENQKNSPLH